MSPGLGSPPDRDTSWTDGRTESPYLIRTSAVSCGTAATRNEAVIQHLTAKDSYSLLLL